MFNTKLKQELERKEALLAQYRERIDALEGVEKENEELKLKLRIMEMYCNDEDAILELLEAKKTKFNVRGDAAYAALSQRDVQLAGSLAGSLAGLAGMVL